MTERLEEIKTRFNAMKELESFKKLAPTDLFFDDLNWLLQQAERVEELETTVDFYQSALRDADRRVQELEEFNRILSSDKSMFIEELVREQQQNKRYREALEWYSENSPHGNIADEALEELK